MSEAAAGRCSATETAAGAIGPPGAQRPQPDAFAGAGNDAHGQREFAVGSR